MEINKNYDKLQEEAESNVYNFAEQGYITGPIVSRHDILQSVANENDIKQKEDDILKIRKTNERKYCEKLVKRNLFSFNDLTKLNTTVQLEMKSINKSKYNDMELWIIRYNGELIGGLMVDETYTKYVIIPGKIKLYDEASNDSDFNIDQVMITKDEKAFMNNMIIIDAAILNIYFNYNKDSHSMINNHNRFVYTSVITDKFMAKYDPLAMITALYDEMWEIYGNYVTAPNLDYAKHMIKEKQKPVFLLRKRVGTLQDTMKEVDVESDFWKLNMSAFDKI